MTTYLAERMTRPGSALFCGPHGQPLSRDALEHRLAAHLATATTTCPSLTTKHVTMHTLRHTAAMNLLAAGVDVSVIALWLGHADTHSTDAYLHADMAIKQAAIDRTRPPNVKPGTYQPEPDIWPGSPRFDYADHTTPKALSECTITEVIGIFRGRHKTSNADVGI